MAPEPFERSVKLSHLRWDSPVELLPRETHLDALALWVKTKPDEVFLDYEGKLLSYADIERSSNIIANGLAGIGVKRGDRVITLLDNSDDLIVAYIAINKLGAIWVPINTAYRGAFLRHQAADADGAVAICEAAYAGALIEVASGLPALTHVLVRGEAPNVVGSLNIASIDTLRDGADTPQTTSAGPDDLSALIYTSGTTGPSKGCMISYAYLSSQANQRNRCIPPGPNDITWSCLPLSHIAALASVLIANLVEGARVAIATRFSVTQFWDQIEQSGATSAMLMASMFPLLAQAPDNPAMLRCRGQLRAVTGVPLSDGDRRIWRERFGVDYMMSFAYGQTEALIICVQPWGAPLPPSSSMGPPAAEFEVMVADDENRPVPIGEVGELCVRPLRPGGMFSGYWRRPDDTLKAMRDLWWQPATSRGWTRMAISTSSIGKRTTFARAARTFRASRSKAP